MSAPAAELDPALLAQAAAYECVEDGEVILLVVKPSPLFIVLGSVRVACMGVVVALGLLAATGDPAVPWDAWHALAAGGTIVVARLAWAASDWWNRLYLLTDRRVIVRAGAAGGVTWMPLREAEFVNAGATGLERLVGLGHVAIRKSPRAPARLAWSCVQDAPACAASIVDAKRRYAR